MPFVACFIPADTRQAGWHNEKRQSYGHSIIISPWGEIKAELGGDFSGPEIAVAEIDLEQVEKVRSEVPLIRRTCVEIPPPVFCA